MNITIEDCDAAEDLLWTFIFNLRDAKTDLEVEDAKENISMQLIEVTNLAWMIGKQTMSVATDKL